LIKLTVTELQYISLLENQTRVTVKDCIITPESITFIVKEGQIGLAVGKKGEIINRIKKKINKEINIYEHSPDLEKFVRNLLFPVEVDKIEIEGKTIKVYPEKSQRKRAIGKQGSKVRKVKDLVERHFGEHEIKIM